MNQITITADNITIKAGEGSKKPISVDAILLKNRFEAVESILNQSRDYQEEIAQNAHISLRELLEKVASTKGLKTLQLRQIMASPEPIVAQFTTENTMLTVFVNGFAVYIRDDNYCVLGVDRFRGLCYQFADRNVYMPLEECQDYEWHICLMLAAENRMEMFHKRYMKEIQEPEDIDPEKDRRMAYEEDYIQRIDPESLEEKELQQLYSALKKLTKNQQEIVYRYYFKNMTQLQIAKELNVSREAIQRVLTRSIASLKRLF